MISFTKHSGIYTLRTTQELSIGIKTAWDFFANPENLVRITPKHMGFEITSELIKKAYAGQIITYRVGVLPGIKTSWVTEITQIKEGEFFIDEQRFGPYSMWHHEHFFEALPNGHTLMRDKISYKIPLGILGYLAQRLFIKKQLIQIFSYRHKVLSNIFNEK